nr:class I SAM-dependent DNA methyltransferase [Acidobacteriota bacterium]
MTQIYQSIQDFITRWKESAAAERANYQLFLSELCDVLEVTRPQPARGDDEQNAYVFERTVTFHNGDGSTSIGRIDLYKRGCFVLEAKQGSDQAQSIAPLVSGAAESAAGKGRKGRKGRRGTAVRGTRGWDVAMREAQGQAEQYVRALAPAEGNPPFVVVVDVGYSIEIYSDFSRAGKTYVPFPDARSHRILIDDLTRDEIRERLHLVWTEPMTLDPSRRSARVTREVAERLAALARSLEDSGYQPERVANFLMRAIFTMFAEDVRLLPARGWTDLLESLSGNVEKFPAMVSSLWETMNAGGFSPIMRETLLRFNGGLFESVEALPITEAQLKLLVEASKLDWREVEPAIFGTLLERALDPLERQMRGAHYTPRAYVERLVMPTVIEPLREEWQSVLAAAITLDDAGKTREAAEEVKAFHRRLCRVRVLDPACGSGNFLYVTLEHLKRLEGEVLDALHGFGDSQGILEDTGLTVDPHQLLGIEKNPRATAITDLVLWIGYLQWHFRTRGEARPPEPVIKKFHNIECRDAVLAYDAEEIVTDEGGEPVTRWDGRTHKKHPVTGEDVPDETARVPVLRYVNARKAEWPEADYIVGNPPFIGNKRMRFALGDGYVEALRSVYEDVPETSDLVMYWWNKAAYLIRATKLSRFGLITTNSITQTFNRKVLQSHLEAKDGVSIIFAIPDHPWVDSKDGAAVRIAMTVAEGGSLFGTLEQVERERETDNDEREITFKASKGKIHSDLSIGVDLESLLPLNANSSISFQGPIPVGEGFRLEPTELERFGLNSQALPSVVRRYVIGRDLMQLFEERFIIDFYGLSKEEAGIQHPALMQKIIDEVKPHRDTNKDKIFREQWWVWGRPRPEMRRALNDLNRFIATCRTSKHRVFSFL